jgi:hypothetical protein
MSLNPFKGPEPIKEDPQPEYDIQEDNQFGGNLPSPHMVSTQWIMDYRYMWAEVEANFRGGYLEWDEINKRWNRIIPKKAMPFMNDRGINDVMTLMRTNCSIITGTSIMKEDRVMRLCEDTGNSLLIMLQNNREEYEIAEGKFEAIYTTFMNVFEANMRKSIDGRALLLLTQSERIIETRNTSPQPPGLLGRVFGMGGQRR